MQIQCNTTVSTTRLSVRLARSQEEVREAQQLRWQVFVDEQGAFIESPLFGYDIDDLDRHCEHLIAIDDRCGSVVGTYRLLTAEAACQAGGYYSEHEFDLAALKRPGVRLLELGRSCVLPPYRTGATIALLWAGLADFLVASRHDALIGCASIPLKCSAAAGSRLAYDLCRAHRAPDELRVTPRQPLPLRDAPSTGQPASIPPLLKGYLRSGAVVCGEPCWDPDFDCADLLLHLSVDRIAGRYARRFLPN
jgi:putative hemolysin